MLDQVYLESLYKDLALLELEYSIAGISYDGIGGSSGTSDMTGETAIRLGQRRADLELEIAKNFKKVQHVDVALKNLDTIERIVLKRHYIDEKTLGYIALELPCSIPTVKRIKKRAMQKMIRQLYGE